MPAPEVTYEIVDTPVPGPTLVDSGTKFLAGLANKGAVTGAVGPRDVITSLADFEARHGTRQSYNGVDYDSVEAFFVDGGSRLFFSRIAGPAAVKASGTGTQFTVAAKGPGAYANGGTIVVASGVATVVVDGVTEVSPTLATVGDLQTWARDTGTLVDITPSVATSTAIANQATVTLASGADDRAAITDTQRQAALARFGTNLGIGEVAMPSRPTIEGHTALATHARDNNRMAQGDLTDTATVATIVAQGLAVRALGRELARHIVLLDGWSTGPGGKTVPASAAYGGLVARVAAGGNPNIAVAGPRAASQYLTDTKYQRTAAELDQLADAGIVPLVNDNGVQPSDDITPVDPVNEPEWYGAAGNRLVMRVIADALQIAKNHQHRSIAGLADLTDFGAELEAMLDTWFAARALFSADNTPAGAYKVQVLNPVNTVATLQQRKLNAALGLRIAPNSRFVNIKLTNVPLTGTL